MFSFFFGNKKQTSFQENTNNDIVTENNEMDTISSEPNSNPSFEPLIDNMIEKTVEIVADKIIDNVFDEIEDGDSITIVRKNSKIPTPPPIPSSPLYTKIQNYKPEFITVSIPSLSSMIPTPPPLPSPVQVYNVKIEIPQKNSPPLNLNTTNICTPPSVPKIDRHFHNAKSLNEESIYNMVNKISLTKIRHNPIINDIEKEMLNNILMRQEDKLQVIDEDYKSDFESESDFNSHAKSPSDLANSVRSNSTNDSEETISTMSNISPKSSCFSNDINVTEIETQTETNTTETETQTKETTIVPPIEIRNFSKDNVISHPNILIIAKRGLGVTTVIQDLLHSLNEQHKYTHGTYFSPAKLQYIQTNRIVPVTSIQNTCNRTEMDKLYEKLLNGMKTKCKSSMINILKDETNTDSTPLYNNYVVFDNCTHDYDFYNYRKYRQLMCNNRLLSSTIITCIPYPCMIRPSSISGYDYVFVAGSHSDEDNIRLHNMTRHIVENKSEFVRMYENLTKNKYNYMVIDNKENRLSLFNSSEFSNNIDKLSSYDIANHMFDDTIYDDVELNIADTDTEEEDTENTENTEDENNSEHVMSINVPNNVDRLVLTVD